MFRLLSAFVIAALFTAFVVDRPANGEDSTIVALNTDRMVGAERALSLDDYAGVYETADGATFVVVRNGESLAVELPESVALPIRAAQGQTFVPDAGIMRIAFEADAGGAVRMVISSSAKTVVATRVALPRGVVTVHDI